MTGKNRDGSLKMAFRRDYFSECYLERTFVCQPNERGEFCAPCVGYFTANQPKFILDGKNPTFIGKILRTGILYSVFCEGARGELRIGRGLGGWDPLMFDEAFGSVCENSEGASFSSTESALPETSAQVEGQILEIRAERDGIFYFRDWRGIEYVKEGIELSGNELLGQIEVMKLYFEVRNSADGRGVLKRWCVSNGTPVHKGDVLATVVRA